MARSQAGLILLHEGATYQEALESSIARELAAQRQAADAADLAKAKPKGPPPHLVGTETTVRRPAWWAAAGAGGHDGPPRAGGSDSPPA